jgi:hypothetical protein
MPATLSVIICIECTHAGWRCDYFGGAMLRTTMTYLEGRYLVLEKEIEYALRHKPTDDLAIADLRYRKLIISDEIQDNRLVERFGKSASSAH